MKPYLIILLSCTCFYQCATEQHLSPPVKKIVTQKAEPDRRPLRKFKNPVDTVYSSKPYTMKTAGHNFGENAFSIEELVSLRKIVRDNFVTSKLLALDAGKEVLNMNFYLDAEGAVREVEFFVLAGSQITNEELLRLDGILKNTKFKVPPAFKNDTSFKHPYMYKFGMDRKFMK